MAESLVQLRAQLRRVWLKEPEVPFPVAANLDLLEKHLSDLLAWRLKQKEHSLLQASPEWVRYAVTAQQYPDQFAKLGRNLKMMFNIEPPPETNWWGVLVSDVHVVFHGLRSTILKRITATITKEPDMLFVLQDGKAANAMQFHGIPQQYVRFHDLDECDQALPLAPQVSSGLPVSPFGMWGVHVPLAYFGDTVALQKVQLIEFQFDLSAKSVTTPRAGRPMFRNDMYSPPPAGGYSSVPRNVLRCHITGATPTHPTAYTVNGPLTTGALVGITFFGGTNLDTSAAGDSIKLVNIALLQHSCHQVETCDDDRHLAVTSPANPVRDINGDKAAAHTVSQNVTFERGGTFVACYRVAGGSYKLVGLPFDVEPVSPTTFSPQRISAGVPVQLKLNGSGLVRPDPAGAWRLACLCQLPSPCSVDEHVKMGQACLSARELVRQHCAPNRAPVNLVRFPMCNAHTLNVCGLCAMRGP